MKGLSKWMAVRIVGIAAVVAAAPSLYNSMRSEFAGQSPSWTFVVAILGITALAIPFVLSLQSMNPFSKTPWSRPSWSSNLFDLRQPLQSIHYSAWLFVALGLSLAVYTAWIDSKNLLFVLPLLIGAGALVGVKLSMLLFRSKLSDAKQERDTA
jgi:hypothetical protein